MKEFHYLTENYIWAVVNERRQSALIIDPGDAVPVLAYLKQNSLTLSGILITHHHWDHVNGVTDLIKKYPVPVFGSQLSQYPNLTHRIADSDIIFINDGFPAYQIIAIPGHTLDHIAYYANNTLFCGDTLFGGGCGRLFEGKIEQLYTSLQKIATLPESTMIYCAHEYTLNNLRFAQIVEPRNYNIKLRMEKVQALRDDQLSSLPSCLLEEKQTNPFLRCEIAEVVYQVEHQAQRSLKRPIDVFAELRKWKD